MEIFPDQGCGFAQFDALGGMNVAIHPAMQNHIASLDVGPQPSIGADREALTAQRDGALDFAVDD